MANNRSWMKRAGEIARSYLANVEELAGRKGYSRMRRKTDTAQRRGVSKPVESAAVRIASDSRITELEREIDAVEWAFEELQKVDGGADIAKLAATLYITKEKVSVERAAFECFISSRTAYRYNRMFLKLVGARMGLWAPQG